MLSGSQEACAAADSSSPHPQRLLVGPRQVFPARRRLQEEEEERLRKATSQRSGAAGDLLSGAAFNCFGPLTDASGPWGQGKGGTQRMASWWGEPQVPWSSYRIDNVPPGCKPLLVFLNTKSGPQMGTRLRRRLLRLLNPIQVGQLFSPHKASCLPSTLGRPGRARSLAVRAARGVLQHSHAWAPDVSGMGLKQV